MDWAKDFGFFLEWPSTYMPMFVNFKPVKLLFVSTQQNTEITHIFTSTEFPILF